MTLLLALVLLAVEAALAFVLPKFGAQMSQEWLQMDFARGIMQAMLGTEIGSRIGPQMFQAMAWVHPVPLALVWAHAIISCSRVPAGEVDRAGGELRDAAARADRVVVQRQALALQTAAPLLVDRRGKRRAGAGDGALHAAGRRRARGAAAAATAGRSAESEHACGHDGEQIA